MTATQPPAGTPGKPNKRERLAALLANDESPVWVAEKPCGCVAALGMGYDRPQQARWQWRGLTVYLATMANVRPVERRYCAFHRPTPRPTLADVLNGDTEDEA